MATNFRTIITAGTDAMSNLYDIYITPPTKLTSVYVDMNSNYLNGYRIRTGDFTPPILGVGEIEVHYKTESYFVPNQMIEGEREFEISFRIDANYDLYTSILRWRNMFFNTSDGSVGRPEKDDEFGSVLVVANKRISESINYTAMPDFANLDSEKDICYWHFTDVWVQGLTNPEFSRDDSSPVKATVKFMFGHVKYRNPKG